MAKRDVRMSYETIGQWRRKFGPAFRGDPSPPTACSRSTDSAQRPAFDHMQAVSDRCLAQTGLAA